MDDQRPDLSEAGWVRAFLTVDGAFSSGDPNTGIDWCSHPDAGFMWRHRAPVTTPILERGTHELTAWFAPARCSEPHPEENLEATVSFVETRDPPARTEG